MTDVNKKIIDAIVAKAEKECPNSLELIGIYGSVATGDLHERSDLDLLILIKDEKGRALSDGFILNDTMIGYDIYTTTWKMLLEDAQCNSAHLSKLLDSEIVYVREKEILDRLEDIRSKTKKILSSDERKYKAFTCMQKAKIALADCYLCDEIDKLRLNFGIALEYTFDALMLFHGKYFKFGTKRKFDELSLLNLPFDVKSQALSVIEAANANDIQNNLSSLVKKVDDIIENGFCKSKSEPCKDNIGGTYEEMFSNWRGKMHEAEENDDLLSSFMNMLSFQFMIDDIAEDVDIHHINVMEHFDSCDLHKNTVAFENALEAYLGEYKRVEISPKTFKNVDEFIDKYIKGR